MGVLGGRIGALASTLIYRGGGGGGGGHENFREFPAKMAKFSFSKTIFESLTVESITSSLQCITATLKAAQSEAASMSLF